MLGVKEYPYGVSAKFDKFPGGGTARYVIGLSEGLVEKGHTVDLIVRRMPEQKKFEVDKGINIYRVPWINNRYFRLPSFNLFAFLKGLKIAKKADIIHTHGSFAAFFGVILSRLYGKKVIGTTHGLTSDQAKYKYNKLAVKGTRFFEKWGYSRLDCIAFLSEAEKKLVIENLKIKPKESVVIYPGIKPLNVKRRKSDKFKVVFIGRLVPMKGLDKFIESFKFLPKDVAEKTKYIIVGDGYYREQLEKLTKKLNLNSSVVFTGYTNNVAKYLEDASLFILPSEGGEGLPCALLEAMSAGVPCMVSNFEAPMESIIVLSNNDPKNIAFEINKLILNPEKINKLSSHSKKVFERHFTFIKFINRYLKVYEDIIK